MLIGRSKILWLTKYRDSLFIFDKKYFYANCIV